MGAAQELEGRKLGEFVVGEKLGEGNFGVVHRASQPALEREAVIKVLHARRRDDGRAVSLFAREARLAAQLDHPYAAHVYAFGSEPDGLMWLAMELVRGTTLAELLRRYGPLLLPRFLPLFEGLCEVVHSAHQHGIIHRDIKPANVMVIAQASRLLPKLLDLGVARRVRDPDETRGAGRLPPSSSSSVAATLSVPRVHGSADVSEDGWVVGSPLYVAPEVWRGEPADARVDIYALGVLAYECLTGLPPFRAGNVAEVEQAHLEAAPPPLGGALPAGLNRVLAGALAKDPGDRFASALDLAAAFRAATSGRARRRR